MSVLDTVLSEEYDRIEKILGKIDEEIKRLPDGYISEKTINGKRYYYLQKREKDTVTSKYIEKSKVDSYRVLIEHRKELEQKKKELAEEQRKISRVID